ncbi:MAG: hypothetical protein ACE5HS_18720 [bacterium]
MNGKRTNFILIIPLISFLLGCDQDNSILPPEQAGLGYFPMQIGNQWQYAMTSNPAFQWEYEIVGKMKLGQREYFVFERRFDQGASVFVDSAFYRLAGIAKIYTYYQGRDALYIDFGRAKGHRWKSYSEYDGIMNQKGFTKTVPAGQFKDCVEIFFDIPQAIDDENWETYAPGVGLLEMYSGWIPNVQLQSAFVNGVSYP